MENEIKVEELIETTENVEDIEIQTEFNEDGFDELCTEDTIIENSEEEE